MVLTPTQLVMPGLDPGIRDGRRGAGKNVDGRDEPGHDDNANHMFESEH
jgi:hypothetical protein